MVYSHSDSGYENQTVTFQQLPLRILAAANSVHVDSGHGTPVTVPPIMKGEETREKNNNRKGFEFRNSKAKRDVLLSILKKYM